MEDIKFCNLFKLLNNNCIFTEKIKDSFLLLLSELTITNYLRTDLFISNLTKIHEQGEIIIAYTGSFDNDNFEIIASGTLIIEPKIIREGKSVGHIEDIVIAKHFRSLGLSQKVLDILKERARKKNCYKVILDCSEEVKNVYIKNGFQVKGIQMAEYFN
jgi:glucosamine-phosphate N-acetyltransferase